MVSISGSIEVLLALPGLVERWYQSILKPLDWLAQLPPMWPLTWRESCNTGTVALIENF